MRKKLLWLLGSSMSCITSFTLGQSALATILTPQPTTCLVGAFTKTGNSYWSNVSLRITNQCGKSVDLQNSVITFQDGDNITTNAWGTFNNLTYPDNNLQITSKQQSQNYLASLSLHFPEESWANSHLADGDSIVLQYGVAADALQADSTLVYLNGQPPITAGEIDLTSTSAAPTGVTDPSATVDIDNSSGIKVATTQLPWKGTAKVQNIAPGTYTIQPVTIQNDQGVYQGKATPQTVTVTSNQTVSSTITYAATKQYGSVNIILGKQPSALSGYTQSPQIKLTQQDSGATTSNNIDWNKTTTISQLENNESYTLSTPTINFGDYACAGSFSPNPIISKSNTPLNSTTLTYNCTQTKQDSVNLNVNNMPDGTPSIDVTLTPTDGSSPVKQTVYASQKTAAVNLVDGLIYNVSTPNIPGYSVTYSLQPLTAHEGTTETMTFQKQTGGRIIAYVPGWDQYDWSSFPTQLANAGYTHVILAFGLFETNQNNGTGNITPDFPYVTAQNIQALQQANIKVLFSIGGASSGVPNTSVDFHSVLQSYLTDPNHPGHTNETFETTFVNSVEKIITDNHLDGVDFDIEHGLNPQTNASIDNPGGDIAVLANIINKLHQDNPNLLISLAPQTANVSPTRQIDGTWGNYSSLIMLTHSALSWVGVQVYNTGCVLGIDQTCYGDYANDPTLSEVMAVDMLHDWPSNYYAPYKSFLDPSQIVLGYPAPNAQGGSDGLPAKSTSVIKQAIYCLTTGNCLKTPVSANPIYTPPQTYSNLGGVFEWEINYDMKNNYAFAKGLTDCVKNGNCQSN